VRRVIVSEHQKNTPACGNLPVTPIVFDPVPVPGWREGCGWTIGGVDLSGPVVLVLVRAAENRTGDWIPLRQCEDIAPIQPWFTM
jgi:hypothetical protein